MRGAHGALFSGGTLAISLIWTPMGIWGWAWTPFAVCMGFRLIVGETDGIADESLIMVFFYAS